MGTALRRGSLDFTTIDRRIPDLVFANPSRWGSDTKRTVCSVDYFTSGLKNDLRNLFSYNRFRLKRTVEPVCGQFAEDIPGTAQGAWFLKGTAVKNYIQGLQLALVHDNLDPTYGVFSVGNGLLEIGIKPEIHNFKPLHSGEYNRDFNEVMPDGKVYCYNAIFGYSEIYGFPSPNPNIKPLLLQLAIPTTLRVTNLSNATSTCGYGPWTIGDKFVNYER